MIEEKKPLEIKAGNVIRRADGSMAVAARDFIDIGRKYVEIVCESPHADGDFSYVCGSDWCRCMQ